MKRFEVLAREYMGSGSYGLTGHAEAMKTAGYEKGYLQAIQDAAEIIIQVENEQAEHASYLLKQAWDKIKALGEE